MSALSKTPDDKMNRYLQRIQKLVGHRGKSPGLMKSRTKSPINIKTSRIDTYLKHEMFFKSVINVWDEHHRKIKAQFLSILIDNNAIKQTKRRESVYSCQMNRKTVRKENDQPLGVRFIVKVLQKRVNFHLKEHFQKMKQFHLLEMTKEQEISARDMKKVRSHRRTYSQIYAQSVSKYQAKSPSVSYRYEQKTPELQKVERIKVVRLLETRLLLSIMEKMQFKFIQSVFSDFKSFNSACLNLEIHHSKINLTQSQQTIQYLKKQCQRSNQELKRTNDKIKEQQQRYELKIATLLKSQKDLQNRPHENQQIVELERLLLQTKGLNGISQTINKKNLSNFIFSFQKIRSHNKFQQSLILKFKFLQCNVKTLVKSRKLLFFQNFRQKYDKHLIECESRQIIVQRTQKISQARIQPLVSSKHSYSSQKSVASHFDLFAQTLNKAFQLKSSLREIYSFGFQKIDEAAFFYMSLADPIKKLLKTVKTQSFRKILFYSFYKSQQRQIPQFSNDSKSLIKSLSQLKNNHQKMCETLKKVEKKILVSKIQTYSTIKLYAELKRQIKVDQKSLIPEKEIRIQIKQFLQQRNKMHIKTCEAWQKTKQMLQESTSQNSSKVSYSSRVKG